jgi:phosphinothricin acetyltransferase
MSRSCYAIDRPMKVPSDIDKLSIRRATPDDADMIAQIYNETISARINTMDLTPKTADDIRKQMDSFEELEEILVLKRLGAVIGWGIIKKYSPRIGYRFAAETSVFLRKTEIRKGYGTHLKSAVIDRCRELGYHHLVAKIWATNTASIEYNTRLGYEMVGIQKEIGYVDGEWRDVAIMQLLLGDDNP